MSPLADQYLYADGPDTMYLVDLHLQSGVSNPACGAPLGQARSRIVRQRPRMSCPNGGRPGNWRGMARKLSARQSWVRSWPVGRPARWDTHLDGLIDRRPTPPGLCQPFGPAKTQPGYQHPRPIEGRGVEKGHRGCNQPHANQRNKRK